MHSAPDEATFRELNGEFRALYGRVESEEDEATPVFVVVADTLVVFRGHRRTDRSFRSAAFHVLKAAAHLPVATYMALASAADRPLEAGTRRTLQALRGAAQASIRESPALADDAAADVRRVLAASIAFVDATLADGAGVADRRARPARLEAFAVDAGPLLIRLTEHATSVQLRSLHAAIESELVLLSPAERGALQVVVTGDHQARARSLGLQYFQKRFGEPPELDGRVTYAEGVDDAAEALALAGKRRLDRQIASAFFGDPRRLQRDVLGDAAARILRDAKLPPIA